MANSWLRSMLTSEVTYKRQKTGFDARQSRMYRNFFIVRLLETNEWRLAAYVPRLLGICPGGSIGFMDEPNFLSPEVNAHFPKVFWVIAPTARKGYPK